jgi:hypothetical protein
MLSLRGAVVGVMSGKMWYFLPCFGRWKGKYVKSPAFQNMVKGWLSKDSDKTSDSISEIF